jgi:hypothetical protein
MTGDVNALTAEIKSRCVGHLAAGYDWGKIIMALAQ